MTAPFTSSPRGATMTDYGHELLFGSFLTPTAHQPDQVVELARVSERAGLDVTTFQDHPYQSRFLDTWTLLSYVAAATTRIRVAGNVINLPLRQPVVLARSAASLDLLSGGRVELGLGAGAFFDAIEANGGRRLSAGQAVAALEEAITIIREVWAVDRRGGVRVDGTYYRVAGAKRGPAPAHDIGIWVGAYKPRMMRLVGRLADGWLPSLSYLPNGPADLADLNARIDEAAVDAGRDPASVRRLLNIAGQFGTSGAGLLNGPPSQWVEELASLALHHGSSGFILIGDDASAIQRFGQEVAPAVRELVAAERSSVAPSGGSGPGGDLAGGVAVAGNDSVNRSGLVPTPAPTVRWGSRPVWDETTRPVAPPPPDGHSYTERARSVGRHFLDVHDHLRQELAQVRDLLQQVKQRAVSPGQARAALNRMTMRQNNWTLSAYCASYCAMLTQHHQIEDSAIFPHLRRAGAELTPVIDRLEAEHVIIHEVVENVDRALTKLASDPDDFTDVQEAVDVLTDALLSHLSYEEQQILEPIARLGFYSGQI